MVGKAEVIHAHGQTTGTISPFIVYYSTRNRLICLFRHGTPFGILINFPRILRISWWSMKNYGLANWQAHKAFIKGTWDFIIGVRGEGNAPKKRTNK